MKRLSLMVMALVLIFNTMAVFAEGSDSTINLTTKLSDIDNWNIEEGKTNVTGNTVTTTQEAIGYKGEDYDEQTIAFTASMGDDVTWEYSALASENRWIGVGLRQKNSTTGPWQGNNRSYIVVVKPHIIELQRWVGGSNQSCFLTKDNVWVKDKGEHNYEAKTMKLEGGGIHYVFAIDGNIVWNFKDTSEDAILYDGYATLFNFTKGTATFGEGTSMVDYSALPTEYDLNPYDIIDQFEDESEVYVPTSPDMLFETADSTDGQSPITILVNGENITSDVSPVLINDTTMVPMRAIFEALNAEVVWDAETQTATATKRQYVISVKIGADYYEGGGGPIAMPVRAYIENGRTMMPLRILAEELGADVNWDGETRTVTVDYSL